MKLRIIFFIIISVGLASSLSLVGGLGIEMTQDKLLLVVPLLVALPALNSLVGDYATLIASHAGNPQERKLNKLQLAKALLPSIVTSTMFILIASLLIAYYRNFNLNSVFLIKYIGFVWLSIISVISIMFALTFVLDKLLINRRINPDDVLIPIITSVSDIFMLGLIALSTIYLF